MSPCAVHSKASTPEQSHPLMDAVARAYGFDPNLAGIVATSPALAQGYLTLAAVIELQTGLTSAEGCCLTMRTGENRQMFQLVPGSPLSPLKISPGLNIESVQERLTETSGSGWIPFLLR